MFKFFLVYLALCIIFISSEKVYFYDFIDPFEKKYSPLPEWKRLEALEKSKEMFYFGYENYIRFAFPQDELDPIHCTGRGPDYQNPYVLKFLFYKTYHICAIDVICFNKKVKYFFQV